jgi:membrane-associated phospholipid phosphatase
VDVSGRDRHAGDFGPGLRPAEVLMVGYLILSALLLLVFGHGLPGSWIIVATHAAIIVILMVAARFGAQTGTALGLLRRAYLIPLAPLLYREMALLNDVFWRGRLFDGAIVHAEQVLFGGDPSQTWSAAWHVTPVSELLHLGYLSYYGLAWGLWIVLVARSRWVELEASLTALVLGFTTCMLWYMAFPVAGPYHHFGPSAAAVPAGFFARLTHAIVAKGSSIGTAFPSSHVAVSWLTAFCALRYAPRAAWVLGALALLLALGTVYGGFHYAIDTIAGAIWAAITFVVALGLQRRWRPDERI